MCAFRKIFWRLVDGLLDSLNNAYLDIPSLLSSEICLEVKSRGFIVDLRLADDYKACD